MGVEYDTNSNFPSDDTGYGFDNIADVLTISPLLLEKYISAAKVIVTKSVPAVSGVAPRRTLPGGLFTKEVLNDGPKNSDVAATPKEEPAGNRFGRPMQGPPKDEPLTLTMSYKEHSIGKMTTNVTTGGKYTVEVNLKAAEQLRQFATKAYRRPVDEETVERLAMLAESVYGSGKETFESGVAQSMTAVLASPRFLFREEGFIQDVDGSHPWLDDYAIASRLSYFLWSTMPDQELMQLAAQGDLRANLDKQVNRMINDPRCSAFFQNFVGQWLQSREVEAVSIDSGAVTRRESDVRPASNSDADRDRRNTLRNKPLAELTDAEKSELENWRIRLTWRSAWRHARRAA